MNVAITLWVLVTKFQTITFIMNSIDKLSSLPADFISSQQCVYKYIMIHPAFQAAWVTA